MMTKIPDNPLIQEFSEYYRPFREERIPYGKLGGYVRQPGFAGVVHDLVLQAPDPQDFLMVQGNKGMEDLKGLSKAANILIHNLPDAELAAMGDDGCFPECAYNFSLAAAEAVAQRRQRRGKTDITRFWTHFYVHAANAAYKMSELQLDPAQKQHWLELSATQQEVYANWSLQRGDWIDSYFGLTYLGERELQLASLSISRDADLVSAITGANNGYCTLLESLLLRLVREQEIDTELSQRANPQVNQQVLDANNTWGKVFDLTGDELRKQLIGRYELNPKTYRGFFETALLDLPRLLLYEIGLLVPRPTFKGEYNEADLKSYLSDYSHKMRVKIIDRSRNERRGYLYYTGAHAELLGRQLSTFLLAKDTMQKRFGHKNGFNYIESIIRDLAKAAGTTDAAKDIATARAKQLRLLA